MKALSYASLDKEDLLSPINQNTLQRSSSVRSMVSNATYGSSDDYIGLALPVDINDMFQVHLCLILFYPGVCPIVFGFASSSQPLPLVINRFWTKIRCGSQTKQDVVVFFFFFKKEPRQLVNTNHTLSPFVELKII